MKNILKILENTHFQKVFFGQIALKYVNKEDDEYRKLLSSSSVLDFIHSIPSHSDIYYSGLQLSDSQLEAKSSSLIFLIEKNTAKEVIGFTVIHNIDFTQSECEISFYIHQKSRFTRLTLDVLIAVADFIYSDIGIDKINIGTFNPKIIHYLERLGLRLVKQNRIRKKRLFSTETVEYYSCQLELESFRNNSVLDKFYPDLEKFQRHHRESQHVKLYVHSPSVQPYLNISNDKISDFVAKLKNNK